MQQEVLRRLHIYTLYADACSWHLVLFEQAVQ